MMRGSAPWEQDVEGGLSSSSRQLSPCLGDYGWLIRVKAKPLRDHSWTSMR